ncbi:MAG: DUF447 family protein [Methanobrevibacter sp.]|jgi:hypothetical protein|nr:DUF447 family protein [Methanobrevibacter sp.]
MNVDLSSIGMEKGQHYETIITTINNENKNTAAPIGMIVKEKNIVFSRIFETATTLDNIKLKKEFIVNISSNPLYLTLSTIGDLPEEYFENIEGSDLSYLKGCDCYLKCEVIEIKKIIKTNDPVQQSEAGLVTAKVKEIVKNRECVRLLNRAIYSLLESLVNYTRIDMVDKEQQDYFLNRLKEGERIINKVGSESQKESITILKETLKNKGFKID